MEKAHTPDLIAEQFNFHCLCNPTPIATLEYPWSETKGLCHLISKQKYYKLPLLLEKLYYYFPSYYHIVMRKWKQLGFSIEVDDE